MKERYICEIYTYTANYLQFLSEYLARGGGKLPERNPDKVGNRLSEPEGVWITVIYSETLLHAAKYLHTYNNN